MLILREPRTTASIPLGNLVVSNPTNRRRRVMLHGCIPLAAADNVLAGQPVTAILPGTGRNELAQVTPNWTVPYAGSKQKNLRVMFPAILNPNDNDMRIRMERSGIGLGNFFQMRGNVLTGMESLGIRFFCGPRATHYVDIKTAGALPAPIRDGNRSRTYVFTGRIYEPSHEPSLRTQAHARVEIECFDDEDYAEIRTKWVICDPRVDEPDGMVRSTWSDSDTEVGFEFIIGNQNLVQPVPWAPEQTVVSLAYQTDRWRWVQDARLTVNTTVCNDVLPWGLVGRASGVLLFKGATGTLGDQLRDDSLAAWQEWPDPISTVSDQWNAKASGAWFIPHIPRPFKRHEHFDQNRDFTYVRNRLRDQVRVYMRKPTNAGRAYLWDRGVGAVNYLQTQYGVDSTGMDDGWVKCPHWESMAYLVPDIGSMARRWLLAVGSPHEFINADGSKVTALNNANLQIEVGSPGLRLGNGDLLGKTRLQSWRQNPNGWLLRSPIAGTPIINGKDRAHYENGAPFAHCAIFGDWDMRDLCETLAYTRIMGEWSNAAWNTGVGDQPRAFARGFTNQGWASWIFGADSAWETQLNGYKTVRMDPLHATAETRFGIADRAQRRYATPMVLQRGSFVGPVRVDLELHEYGRWWEDVHAIMGLIAMSRHLVPLYPSLSWISDTLGQYMGSHIYSCPRSVSADGRVEWTVFRPDDNNQPLTIYEPAAAVAIPAPGIGALSQTQWEQNNWSICNYQSGGQCSTANTGFARLGTPNNGTGTFCLPANDWLYNGFGANGNPRLVRYAYDSHQGRTENPRDIDEDVFLWLTRFGVSGAFAEWLHVPTNVTTRANIGFAPSGVAMLSDGRLIVTRQGSSAVSIVDRAAGVVQTINPNPAANWSGVSAQRDKVTLLDGYDPNQTRFALPMYETNATLSPMVPYPWLFPGFEYSDVRGIAYDPTYDSYMVCAYRNGRTKIWLVPLTGGEAVLNTTISTHEDFDTQPQSIAISQDGKLLAMGRSDGTVWLHTRALGGYWSHPRLRVQRGGWVTFTRHNREDDALRLVSISVAGQIVESEV